MGSILCERWYILFVVAINVHFSFEVLSRRKLRHNYRSGGNIGDVCNNLIKLNKERIPKVLVSPRKTNLTKNCICSRSRSWISFDRTKDSWSFSEQYLTTYWQLRDIEKHLLRHDIIYQLPISCQGFYKAKEVKFVFKLLLLRIYPSLIFSRFCSIL